MYVNIPKLIGKMAECGYSPNSLAEPLGLSKATMARRISGGGKDFTIGEVQRMSDFLNMSKEESIHIFLSKESQ